MGCSFSEVYLKKETFWWLNLWSVSWLPHENLIGKVVREYIFELAVVNETLHESYDNGVCRLFQVVCNLLLNGTWYRILNTLPERGDSTKQHFSVISVMGETTTIGWGYVTFLGGAMTSASSHHKVRWNKCQLKHGSFLSLPTGIINLMLSSQSSLAVRCLIYGELPKAKQVIKVSDSFNHACTASNVFLHFRSVFFFPWSSFDLKNL